MLKSIFSFNFKSCAVSLPVILPNIKCAAEMVSFRVEPSKGLTHHVTDCCFMPESLRHIKIYLI